jgi:hypothetical protein
MGWDNPITSHDMGWDNPITSHDMGWDDLQIPWDI